MSISLRRRSRYILYLMMIIGFLFGMINVRQTLNPTATYGNQVYDSAAHIWGFILTKPFLFLNWVLVYPIAIYVTVHVTISMMKILNYMCAHSVLRIDFFHPDNCGGVSVFGDINTYILGVYINFFAVLVALDLTHERQYGTLIFFTIFASVCFVVQSIGAVYAIRRFVQAKKRECLEGINKQLDEQMRTAIPLGRFPADLLLARKHVLSLSSHPYTRQASIVVNAIRWAPAAVLVIRLVQ